MGRVIRWWKRKSGHKYINGGRGVISIFLAALMLPFLTMADYLVESQRYHEATTILDEVMDSANLSTLSNYNEYIEDRFGLVTVSQATDIEKVFNSYLNANLDTYSTWSNVNSSAAGAFPLSDTSVLMNQVLECSKYAVPTELAGDFVLSDIISTLEKIKGINKIAALVSKSAGAADSAVTLTEDALSLVSAEKALTSDINSYTADYSAFKTAIGEYANALAEVSSKQNTVNDLSGQLNSVNSDISDLESEKSALDTKLANEEITQAEYNSQVAPVNSEIAGKNAEASDLGSRLDSANNALSAAQATAAQKKTSYENAQSAYSATITALKGSLVTYQTAADKVAASVVAMRESLGDVGKAAYDYDTYNAETKLKDDQEKIQKQIDAENAKAEADKDEGKIREWEKAKSALAEQLDETKAENETAGNIAAAVKDGGEAYVESLNSAMNGYDSAVMTACGNQLDVIKSHVDALTSAGITESTSIADADYYITIPALIDAAMIETVLQQAEEGAKASGIMDTLNAFGTTFRSLFTSNGIYDSRLDAYLSDTAAYTPGIIDAILNDISELIGYLETAVGGLIGMIKIVTHLRDILVTVKNLLTHIGMYIAEMVTNTLTALSELLSNKIGEKFLLDEYLVYTLSNRTDMGENSSMSGNNPLTGYSFSKVKYAECEEGNSIPITGNITALITLLSDVRDGGDDLMFCGAELEYIFVGSRSELINQTVVFFDLYFLRLLLDIGPIMCNMEVQDMATAAGTPTFGIGSVVVYVLEILIEPFIDTLLIVNGEDISLIKKVVYLTPTGSLVLIQRLAKMKLNQDQIDKIKTESSKLTKTTAYISSPTKDNGGITWGYEDYMMVFMLVMGDNETYLKRFQNIISLETNAYDGAGTFDIEKAYTYIDADVTASYHAILPLDNLSNLSMMQINRSRSRGY